MKVLLINGSPNKNGCTYTALKEISDTLNKEGIETEIYYIGKDPIAPCRACRACGKLGKCIIKDKVKQRTIKSTGFQNGISYICILPDSTAHESKRILVGKNGKDIIKEYNTPKEIKDFFKTFKKYITGYKN